MHRAISVSAILMVWMMMATVSPAGQVRLEVSMAHPTLLAAKKHTTLVKVGLTGFQMDDGQVRAPVNVAIVLDKSGSMTGDKIAKAKDAAIAAVKRLEAGDIVSVVAYDSTVKVIVPATKLSDKRAVVEQIKRLTAGGSTALFAGVSKGAQEIRKFLDGRRVNRVILLSDGLANVGPKSPSELAALGASLMKEGISVSTMGLGLDFNEDLMTQLAQKSGGNHVFIEQAEDLVRIFNYEFNDVLSVVAQEVAIEIQVARDLRPVRVLNMDAEINGQQVIASMNQLYSQQEKYLLLEVEVPPTKAGETRRVAEVHVSYANMQTKTTDRLTSTVSVNFSELLAAVEQRANVQVCAEYVLQVSNEQSKLATILRDKGDIAAARQVLLANSAFLEENAKKYDVKILHLRCVDNRRQAHQLDGSQWNRVRKLMRQQQYADSVQQRFSGSEVKNR